MIRVRLTIWYVALLGLVLIAFSGLLYLSFASGLHDQLHQSLSSEAQRLIANVELESGVVQLGEGSDTLPPGMIAALHDPSGQLLESTDARQPLPTAGHDWVVLSLPVTRDGEQLGTLTIARSDADVEAATRELLLLILIAVPLTLVLASAGGLFLAGRALGPIDRITRAAADIGADDLSRRLHVRGDDEVGRLANTFDNMLERLEQAFHRQRQFTSDASHELRTPLTLLASQIDVALERPRSAAEYRRVLRSLRADTARMSSLVTELLTLARADAGQDLLHPEPVDLPELVYGCAGAMQPLAERRGVRLAASADAGTIEADQVRMTQLLINLIDNALRHTAPGGFVRVSAAVDGGAVRVSVSDTGCGIPSEHVPHIFDRFYRVDTARARADGGSGLGLSICRWIAEAHRGSLSVTSEPGRGSTFTLNLPRFTLASSSSHMLGTLCAQLLLLLL